MAKKLKVDPETQARQALVFFTNLKDAVKALDKLVDYNIADIKKTLDRMAAKAEKDFASVDNDQQKTFN